MRSLEILHVTPYCEDAWAYGGIPRVVGALGEGLARRGHRVSVLTTDARDGRSRLPRHAWQTASGVEVRAFRNLSNVAAYHLQFFVPPGLAIALRSKRFDVTRFDIAHLHGCHHLPGVWASRALGRAGVPYVLSPHGTALRIERRRAAKWLFDITLGRRVLPKAARVAVVSEAERLQLRGLGVEAARLRHLPNPLQLEEFDRLPPRGRFRATYGLGEDVPVVLFLGKLTPRKRVDVVLEAVAQMHESVRLVVAGNNLGAGEALRRQARNLGLEGDGRVVWTGLLPGASRLEVLVDADVLAYPSEHEIFGLAALEALLCGLPVAVADDSGCGEVVAELGGDDGLATQVVPVGDANALATALENALAEPKRARTAAWEAARQIREHYATEVICERLEEIYRETLDREMMSEVSG